jgi:hypothetical protein
MAIAISFRERGYDETKPYFFFELEKLTLEFVLCSLLSYLYPFDRLHNLLFVFRKRFEAIQGILVEILCIPSDEQKIDYWLSNAAHTEGIAVSRDFFDRQVLNRPESRPRRKPLSQAQPQKSTAILVIWNYPLVTESP